MKILVNAVYAVLGGGVTYLESFSKTVTRLCRDDEFIFCVRESQAGRISGIAPNIRVVSFTGEGKRSLVGRIWFDQVVLRRIIRREKVDALFSTSNFGMWNCPCRQLLYVRNCLYFSEMYARRFLKRQKWWSRGMYYASRWLICRSVKWADVVMVPSQSMLDELRKFVELPPQKALLNYPGSFFRENKKCVRVDGGFKPCPVTSEFKLLCVMVYMEGGHKNLTTLLRAAIFLREREIKFRLLITDDLNRNDTRLACTWKDDVCLAGDSRLADCVEFLGLRSSREIERLCAETDILVYPSPIESFGFPLLEAMSAGLPIVAADSPINREICQDAALYFSPFDAEAFAAQICRVMEDEETRLKLVLSAKERIVFFDFDAHVMKLREALAAVPQ